MKIDLEALETLSCTSQVGEEGRGFEEGQLCEKDHPNSTQGPWVATLRGVRTPPAKLEIVYHPFASLPKTRERLAEEVFLELLDDAHEASKVGPPFFGSAVIRERPHSVCWKTSTTF